MKDDLFNAPIIGLDEVGRGPLAGPVVAAAVYFKNPNLKLKEKYLNLKVTDSKKLSTKKRQDILHKLKIDYLNLKAQKVYEHQDFYFCVSEISAQEIDKVNILNASLLAMENSLFAIFNDLKFKNLKVLIDGNKNLKLCSKNEENSRQANLNYQTVIKGDSQYIAIAMASIIAKEYRDHLMQKLDRLYPDYEFSKHSGYPTAKHKENIKRFGVLDVHRKTFKGVKEFL